MAPPGEAWALGAEMSNVTNSTPYTEGDARWCYRDGKVDACVRVAVLFTMSVITGIALTLRIIQYHCYRSKVYHQYAIYYLGLLIAILCIIHFAYVHSAIMDFSITYLGEIQLLLISLFFTMWAARTLNKEKLFGCIVAPVLVVAFVYFTAVTAWAFAVVKEPKYECTRPQWVIFTVSQLVVVQLFAVAVIYISRYLNNIHTLPTNRLSQKAQLWGLIIVYETVSIIALAYDMFLLITRNQDLDCGKMFTSNDAGLTIIYIAHKMIKYLLPQWAILIIFWPLRRQVVEDDAEESTSWAEKPNPQSTFYGTESHDGDRERERLLPYPVHSSIPTSRYDGPILPRHTPSSQHSSYFSSPWLKLAPGETFPSPRPINS